MPHPSGMKRGLLAGRKDDGFVTLPRHPGRIYRNEIKSGTRRREAVKHDSHSQKDISTFSHLRVYAGVCVESWLKFDKETPGKKGGSQRRISSVPQVWEWFAGNALMLFVENPVAAAPRRKCRTAK